MVNKLEEVVPKSQKCLDFQQVPRVGPLLNYCNLNGVHLDSIPAHYMPQEMKIQLIEVSLAQLGAHLMLLQDAYHNPQVPHMLTR